MFFKRAGERFHFRSGEGEQPGIFNNCGKRLAWWPQEVEPTSDRLDVAFAMVALLPPGAVIQPMSIEHALKEQAKL